MKAETYQDIGELLRHNRERLGVDVLSAAHALHIRAKYLEAVEEGRMADLPGNAYARGYVINYGAYLGLDRDEVAGLFDSIGTLHPRSLFHLPDTLKKEQKPSRRVIWASLAITVLVAVMWSMASRGARPPLVVPQHAEHAEAVPPRPSPAPVALPEGFFHPCFDKRATAYPPCTASIDPAAGLAPQPKIRSLAELRDATPVKDIKPLKQAQAAQPVQADAAAKKKSSIYTHVYSPPQHLTPPPDHDAAPMQQ